MNEQPQAIDDKIAANDLRMKEVFEETEIALMEKVNTVVDSKLLERMNVMKQEFMQVVTEQISA
jgi:hypothetical protein